MTEKEVHECMYRVVEKNIPEPGGKGLFLLPGATGSGKTHAVCDFIAQNAYLWKKNGAKVYFTTKLLKNLPACLDETQERKQLERAYERAGKRDSFKDEVVVLRSAREHLKPNWKQLDVQIDGILEGQPELYKEFLKYRKQVNQFLASYEKNEEEDVFYEKQRFFIKAVRLALENAYPLCGYDSFPEALQARKKAIFDHPSWSWISQLWPDHYVEKATVILLSLRKFTLPLITVLARSAAVKDSLPEGSLVFIDEFDDAKTAMLDFIIDDCMEHEVELIELSNLLGDRLLRKSFPPEMYLRYGTDNETNKNEWFEKKREQYRKLQTRFEGLKKTYSLEYTLKTHPDDLDTSVRFLNRSFQPFIWSGSARDKIIITDTENSINWIRNKHTRTDKNFVWLTKYVSDLFWFVESFLEFCNDLILNKKNYLEKVREMNNGSEIQNWNVNSFTSSLIEYFVPYGSKEFTYVYNTLLRRLWVSKKWKINPEKFDIDQFYTRGFFRIFLKDSEQHEMKTHLNMLSFGPTPEAWIASLAQRAYVFGLSATAYIEQPLTNFSLDYIKRNLGSSFKTISKEDMQNLHDLYKSSTRGYTEIKFNPPVVELIQADCANADDWINRWASWLNDRTHAEHVYNLICTYLSDDGLSSGPETFQLDRYDRIFQMMTRMSSRSIPNALYALTANLFSSGSTFAREPLIDFHEGLLVAFPEYPWNLTFLDSTEFELNLSNLNTSLAARNRHFICTSYSTISRGINLQYNGTNFPEAIHVHEYPRKKGDDEIDVDGIFIEKPTNILSLYNEKNSSAKNIMSRLVDLHYLAAGGYVTESEFEKMISSTALKNRYNNITPPLVKGAINAGIASQVFQALGRITRTGKRLPEISIATAQGLPQILSSVPIPKEIVCTHEYNHVLTGQVLVDPSLRREEQIIEILSNRMNRIILNILTFITKEQNRIDWQDMRTAILMFPVNPNWESEKFQCMYCEIPQDYKRYFYRTHSDFQECEVKIAKPIESGYSEVSELNSGLQDLMKIEGMKDFFDSRNYAIKWNPSSVLLSPVAFNNIYKGSLGEVALEFFFKQALEIELLPMPDDYFEVFDFMIKPGVYVDSKFWAVGPELNDAKEQKRILDKLKKIGGSRVFIINTLPVEREPDLCVLSSFPELVLINAVFIENEIWKNAADEIRRFL